VSRAAVVLCLLTAACRGAASGDAQRPRAAETAQARARRAPCDLLQAVAGALRGAASPSWSITFDGGCCTEPAKVELRAALVGFEFMPRPDLLGWNARCPAGIGGPVVKNGADVTYHYVELREKDARTLAFDLTPAYQTFDARGKKVNDVMQGCPDVNGLAALKD
jgi:hypothetical protein